MIKKFKSGDLVAYFNGWDNGVSTYLWCKLLDLMVEGQSQDQYDIVTGRGDENTKATFKLKPIGVSYNNIWDMSREIEPIDKPPFWTDKSHDIELIETIHMEKLYREFIQKVNYKIDFIRQHRNRIEKLEQLLD